MKAIAAMSRNRVIGRAGKVPWYLPEELRWFKETTINQAVLMGRRTFESLDNQPLPHRLNLVASRSRDYQAPGVEAIHDLEHFRPADYAPREVWLIGGSELYALLLDRCSDLYLTIVKILVDGDTFFPSFENSFRLEGIILQDTDFEVRHYRRE